MTRHGLVVHPTPWAVILCIEKTPGPLRERIVAEALAAERIVIRDVEKEKPAMIKCDWLAHSFDAELQSRLVFLWASVSQNVSYGIVSRYVDPSPLAGSTDGDPSLKLVSRVLGTPYSLCHSFTNYRLHHQNPSFPLIGIAYFLPHLRSSFATTSLSRLQRNDWPECDNYWRGGGWYCHGPYPQMEAWLHRLYGTSTTISGTLRPYTALQRAVLNSQLTQTVRSTRKMKD